MRPLEQGEAAVLLLKAVVRQSGYPDSVPDIPEFRELFAELEQSVADLPPGVAPEIPWDYNDAPDPEPLAPGPQIEQYAWTGDGIELGFSPLEKRDEHGRWTRGGAHYAVPDPDRLVYHHRRGGAQFYRSPADHPFFQKHPPSSAHIVAAYDQASDQEKAQGMRWYADVHNLAAKLDHGDIEMNAGVIAALSPQSGWAVNILNADRSLDEGRALGPGEGMITADMQAAAQRAMDGMDADDANISPKTKSFARLIRAGGDEPGDVLGQVAVDRHALTVAIGVRLPKAEADKAPIGKERFYQHVADQYRLAALEISKRGTPITPYQIQAVTWLRQQRINEAEDLASDTMSTDVASARGGRRLAKGRSTMLRHSWENWMAEARRHEYPLVPGITAINATEQFAASLLGIELGFSERELRDSRGRWTRTGESMAADVAARKQSFSISVRSGQEPAHGYMVAQTGHTHTYPASVLDDRQEAARAIDEMLMSEREAFEGTDTYLGGWVHGGKLWLEPSDNIASRDEAVRTAASRNQIAIWDVDNGAEIQTGGAGGSRIIEHAEGTGEDPARLLGLARGRAPGGSGGPGSPAPGGLAAQFLEFGFNPLERRDRRGRWTRGGMAEAAEGKTVKLKVNPSRFQAGDLLENGKHVAYIDRYGGGGVHIAYQEGGSGVYSQRMKYEVTRAAEPGLREQVPLSDLRPVETDYTDLESQIAEDVSNASGIVPKLLHSKHETWNGTVQVQEPTYTAGGSEILAAMEWDGTLTLTDHVAQDLQTDRAMYSEPVRDPASWEVLEHEMIHGVTQPGTTEADKQAYKSYPLAQIEEGFTELGSAHHAPEFMKQMGLYDRRTTIMARDEQGNTIDNPDYWARAAKMGEAVASVQERLRDPELKHDQAQVRQLTARLQMLETDLRLGILGSGGEDREVVSALRHSGWPEFAADAERLDRQLSDLLDTPQEKRFTVGGYAERLTDPVLIDEGNAWGHYATQTKDAQDWVQLVAREEGNTDLRPGTTGYARVVRLTDDINRMGAAGKVEIMARQLAVAMASQPEHFTHRNDPDYMDALTGTIRDAITDQWSLGRARDTFTSAKQAGTQKMQTMAEAA